MQDNQHVHHCEFYTDTFCVVGVLRSYHARLSDALNQFDGRFMVLHEATLRGYGDSLPWAAPNRGDRVQLDMDSVLFVAAQQEARPDDAEDAATRRIAKNAYLVSLVVPPFCVQGEVYLIQGARQHTIDDFLVILGQRFIPVTNAIFFPLAEPQASTDADFLVVNKRCIRLAYPVLVPETTAEAWHPAPELATWASATAGVAAATAQPAAVAPPTGEPKRLVQRAVPPVAQPAAEIARPPLAAPGVPSTPPAPPAAAAAPGTFETPAQRLQAMLAAGIGAVGAGDHARARGYFRAATELAPDDELAWLWLSSVAENAAETVRCMEHVLAINPAHQKAREIVEWARQQRVRAAAAGAGATPPAAAAGSAAAPPAAAAGAGATPPAAAKPAAAPSSAVIPLGEYFVQAGLVSREQLQIALALQNRAAQAGVAVRLGEVMVELGYATAQQVANLVREQERDFHQQFRD